MRWALCAVVLAGCWKSKPSPPPLRPLEQTEQTPRTVTREPGPGSDLYDLDEALADALAQPWTFVGTGEWFGMFRVNACVYKNDRVFIVNPYCTLKEKLAAGVLVLSPKRGRVYIYAEGDKPTSTTKRPAWMTFKAESNISSDPPVSLSFTYAELRAWDEKRYYQNMPGCFSGVEIRRPQDGCYKLDAKVEKWGERNREFLTEPPPDYYRIVRELRDRAIKDARPYTGP